MPDWLWPAVIGGVVAIGVLWFGAKIIRKRMRNRHDEKRQQEFQRKLLERDAKRDALKAIQEASGLWSWWYRHPLDRGQIYTLTEHNIPVETKKEREGSSRTSMR